METHLFLQCRKTWQTTLSIWGKAFQTAQSPPHPGTAQPPVGRARALVQLREWAETGRVRTVTSQQPPRTPLRTLCRGRTCYQPSRIPHTNLIPYQDVQILKEIPRKISFLRKFPSPPRYELLALVGKSTCSPQPPYQSSPYPPNHRILLIQIVHQSLEKTPIAPLS